MTEITTTPQEHSDFVNQNHAKMKVRLSRSDHFTVVPHHEALRRATLLKHRKVSTQLKLDMVQRQLAELRNSSSSSDRQFYRSQLSELSSELQDLGSTLEKVERNAFYARRRLLKCYGVNGSVQLSASHPTIYSSSETLDQASKHSVKNRVHHLMSSPTLRFKKKHLMGELRAVASLSSLNAKSNSSCDDIPSKDFKTWKSPLRFLGQIMDNRICRRIWGSSKRIKSEEHLDQQLPTSTNDISDGFSNGLKNTDDFSSTSSSSESSDDSEDENKNFDTYKTRRCVWKGPVERKVSKSQNQQQIDPALLAEIEDFEKMAAHYIKLHSEG